MRNCCVGTLFLIITTSAYGAVVTGPITNPSNGHAYYKLAFGQSWTASEAEAQSLGGHLVTINDAAENNWVADTFGQFNNLYWTGLNDAATPDTFVWSSGDPSSYRNWYPGEPGNSPTDWHYVALLTDQTRQWLPRANTQGAWGIVEVVPEPSGLAVAASALALGVLPRRGRRTAA
jgi:hypothetical protein